MVKKMRIFNWFFFFVGIVYNLILELINIVYDDSLSILYVVEFIVFIVDFEVGVSWLIEIIFVFIEV